MFRALSMVSATLAALTLPVSAQEGRIDALVEALRLPEVIEIMQTEGIAHGEEIGESLLAGRGGQDWSRVVAEIHSGARLDSLFFPRFEAELAPAGDAVEAMLDFFTGPLGATVIGLEISARRALLDDEVESAARDYLEDLLADGDPRLEQLRQFVDANELVEENVVGGLNSTYAFYVGMVESGAPGFDLPQEQILAEVWSQEDDIREEMQEWLYSFLALAYRPLSDDELDAYVAFSETEAGQKLNRALFAAFNAMFERLSEDLGREAGRFLSGRDI
jgi:hypothetical protein